MLPCTSLNLVIMFALKWLQSHTYFSCQLKWRATNVMRQSSENPHPVEWNMDPAQLLLCLHCMILHQAFEWVHLWSAAIWMSLCVFFKWPVFAVGEKWWRGQIWCESWMFLMRLKGFDQRMSGVKLMQTWRLALLPAGRSAFLIIASFLHCWLFPPLSRQAGFQSCEISSPAAARSVRWNCRRISKIQRCFHFYMPISGRRTKERS